MPPSRSQYSRPAASMSFAPLPARGWNEVRAYVPRMYSRSRDSTSAISMMGSLTMPGTIGATGPTSGSDKVRSSVAAAQCLRVLLGPGDDDVVRARLDRLETSLELGPHAAADRAAV